MAPPSSRRYMGQHCAKVPTGQHLATGGDIRSVSCHDTGCSCFSAMEVHPSPSVPRRRVPVSTKQPASMYVLGPDAPEKAKIMHHVHVLSSGSRGAHRLLKSHLCAPLTHSALPPPLQRWGRRTRNTVPATHQMMSRAICADSNVVY